MITTVYKHIMFKSKKKRGLFIELLTPHKDTFDPLNETVEINGALLWEIPLGRLTSGGELKKHNALIALQKIQINQIRARVNEEVISAREQILVAKEQTKGALEESHLGERALKQGI